jgi:hypothetical protein
VPIEKHQVVDIRSNGRPGHVIWNVPIDRLRGGLRDEIEELLRVVIVLICVDVGWADKRGRTVLSVFAANPQGSLETALKRFVRSFRTR